MTRIIGLLVAVAALPWAGSAPAMGQTYNPYITVDTAGAPKKGKGSTYLRMGQPPGGTSKAGARKKPPPVLDYDDDDLPAGNRERRGQRLKSR